MPATHTPNFSWSDGVHCVPVNELANIRSPWERYVVIGAGKTGLDALLFLLNRGVDPGRIFWIVSYDCWYLNRDGMDNFSQWYLNLAYSGLQAENINEAFKDLEKHGYIMRVDKEHWPTR